MHCVSIVGGDVDLNTLVQLIHQQVTNPPVERAEDLRDVFRLYDKEGRGYVSVAEMRHLLTSVGEKLTDDEAEELLRMSGCVHNGMVQYDSKQHHITGPRVFSWPYSLHG